MLSTISLFSVRINPVGRFDVKCCVVVLYLLLLFEFGGHLIDLIGFLSLSHLQITHVLLQLWDGVAGEVKRGAQIPNLSTQLLLLLLQVCHLHLSLLHTHTLHVMFFITHRVHLFSCTLTD